MGCEHFPLDHRERDCDLIEPAGVDRSMDQNDTRIDLIQPFRRSGTALRRTMVHDPAQACAGTVWFLRQHLVDQAAKGYDTSSRFTPSHHIPSVHIPCRQIWQSTAAFVFVLDIGRSAWRG